MSIVCWNINKQLQPWQELAAMAADPAIGADVALLQEAGMPPPAGLPGSVALGPMEHWDSHVWVAAPPPPLLDRRSMVVKLSDRVKVDWFKQVRPISEVACDEIAVSGIGTIGAARISPGEEAEAEFEPFFVVSMYARWIKPHPLTQSWWSVGYSDGSAHRIISDLSAFIGHTDPATHRILAAGDLNMIYGALPGNPLALAERERTVWDRMDALGMEFLGPQHPNGRQAYPRPAGLPPDTKNVVTHRQNQLDHAFASRGFHKGIKVRAMNHPDGFGSSDHCRLLITVSL